jgi:hypothetical protein
VGCTEDAGSQRIPGKRWLKRSTLIEVPEFNCDRAKIQYRLPEDWFGRRIFRAWNQASPHSRRVCIGWIDYIAANITFDLVEEAITKVA